jgi:hypothetical protein
MIDSMPGGLAIVCYALVYVLATARLTVLVAFDEITRPVREAAIRRLDPAKCSHRKLTYLLGGASDEGNGCPWCLSIWVGAGVVPAAWWWHDQLWLLLPALVLAASQVTGMIAGIGRG